MVLFLLIKYELSYINLKFILKNIFEQPNKNIFKIILYSVYSKIF